MDEDILMKFAGLMHHRIGFIGILQSWINSLAWWR